MASPGSTSRTSALGARTLDQRCARPAAHILLRTPCTLTVHALYTLGALTMHLMRCLTRRACAVQVAALFNVSHYGDECEAKYGGTGGGGTGQGGAW